MTRIANVIEGLRVDYYGEVTKYGTEVVEHTLVRAQFPDPVDQEPYRVFGLLEVSGNLTSQGDSGGCVYHKTGAGVNRIVGCITRADTKRNVNYFTPVIYIEEQGFDFD